MRGNYRLIQRIHLSEFYSPPFRLQKYIQESCLLLAYYLPWRYRGDTGQNTERRDPISTIYN